MASSNDFTRKKKKIDCKPELVISSLHTFYSTCKELDKIMPYLTGDTKISLRLIDWFVTNYCRKMFIGYPLNGQEFLIYLSYKSQLRAYSKQLFDPNCRRERILFEIPGNEPFLTTVGKLNFFRWAYESRVLQYIEDHLEEIEKERDNDRKETKEDTQQQRRNESESSTDSIQSKCTIPSEASIRTTIADNDNKHISLMKIASTTEQRPSPQSNTILNSTRRRRNKSIPSISCHIQRYDTEVKLSFD